MPEVVFFRGATGLNTRVDPARLRYDPKTGVQDLAVAYNVDIDDTGRISRRKGFTQRVALSVHSLFAKDDICLFVSGSGLYQLHADYSYSALMNVMAGARMSYAAVNRQVYFVNGIDKGIFENGAVSAWTLPASYVGPDTTREFSGPPNGSIVEFFNGRMYVIQANFAFFSEAFDYSRFDLARGFLPFEENILMFRAVTDGIWVGTTKRIEFLAGNSPQEFHPISVADYPPVQYSDVALHGKLIQTQDGTPIVDISSGDSAILWLSRQGICYGGPSGVFQNLTQHKLATFPVGSTGSGVVIDGRYIGLIDP